MERGTTGSDRPESQQTSKTPGRRVTGGGRAGAQRRLRGRRLRQPGRPADQRERCRAEVDDLSHQSEQLNQQALKAQEDLNAKQAVERDADAKLATANQVVGAAQAQVHRFQPAVDRTAIAAYMGARTNRLFSVLASDSPQQLLDQMSTLDVIQTQTGAQLAQYLEGHQRRGRGPVDRREGLGRRARRRAEGRRGTHRPRT